MKKIFILFVVALVSFSCSNPYEDVVFLRIEQAELLNITRDSVELQAVCVMYNPNDIGLQLKQADFDVYINNYKSANIHQTSDAIMPGNSEFEFPIKAQLSPKDLIGKRGNQMIDIALQVLGNKKVAVKYDGSVDIEKGVFSITVPVVDSLEVPVKFKF
ncbi:LEA type 2 family protein [Nonlabens sp. SCSIO 43208]|uniref:LEA type 2 family protein n=1 Tax=Nonlabens sp. SCSIO 43208 TaxID=2793009 RepID=UPI003D6BF631